MSEPRFRPGQRVRDVAMHRDLWIHCGPLRLLGGPPLDLETPEDLDDEDLVDDEDDEDPEVTTTGPRRPAA